MALGRGPDSRLVALGRGCPRLAARGSPPPVLLRGRGGGGGGGGSGGGGDEGGSAVLFKVFLGVSSDLFERAGAHGFADELRFKNDHERAHRGWMHAQWRALSITSERGRFFSPPSFSFVCLVVR